MPRHGFPTFPVSDFRKATTFKNSFKMKNLKHQLVDYHFRHLRMNPFEPQGFQISHPSPICLPELIDSISNRQLHHRSIGAEFTNFYNLAKRAAQPEE